MLRLQHVSAEAKRRFDLVCFDTLLSRENRRRDRRGCLFLYIAKRFSSVHVLAEEWIKPNVLTDFHLRLLSTPRLFYFMLQLWHGCGSTKRQERWRYEVSALVMTVLP